MKTLKDRTVIAKGYLEQLRQVASQQHKFYGVLTDVSPVAYRIAEWIILELAESPESLLGLRVFPYQDGYPQAGVFFEWARFDGLSIAVDCCGRVYAASESIYCDILGSPFQIASKIWGMLSNEEVYE